MKTFPRLAARNDQKGSTLIIVIVLLLLATLIVVFAVNLGVLTQRTSGNDMRARLVQQTADSALSQAAETLLSDATILPDESRWALCDADDATFPCGAVPKSRRAFMYYFTGGAAGGDKVGVFRPSGTAMHDRMLDMSNKFTTVNDGFNISYGVGAVMCRLKPAELGEDPECSTDTAEKTRVYAVTLVAVAAMPDEGARATAVRSFATSTPLGLGVDVPPITASGVVNLSGTLQVVAGPNSGGNGQAVSVWSRGDIEPNGTPNSCQAWEFYNSVGIKNAGPLSWVGTDNRVLRCDDCNCDVGSLTSIGAGKCTGGSDLLSGGTVECGTNDRINTQNPDEFPCDLFEYIFGVPAWEDLLPNPAPNGDNFCETKIFDIDSFGKLGADESYLLENADWIISDDDFGGRLPGTDARKLANCNTLAGKSGLIWDRDGDCANVGTDIGTPDAPVLLVYDGVAPFHTALFGLLFVRTTDPGPTVAETEVGPDFQINAGTAIYGSLVVQGKIKSANGTAAVIHNSDVLNQLIKDLNRPKIIALPGSWSDNVRY